MPKLIFASTLSIDEWRDAGLELGSSCRNMSRVEFDREILVRAAALSRLLRDVPREAFSAFDQAAWAAWEVGLTEDRD